VFQLRRNGRPFLDVEARRQFLSKFTCQYAHAGLSVFPWTNEADGQAYGMQWKGFPNQDFEHQFLTYMSWIPGAKVQANQAPSRSQKQEAAKALAHLAPGCAMLLEYCVEPRLAAPDLIE
jgi:hypothetical protein